MRATVFLAMLLLVLAAPAQALQTAPEAPGVPPAPTAPTLPELPATEPAVPGLLDVHQVLALARSGTEQGFANSVAAHYQGAHHTIRGIGDIDGDRRSDVAVVAVHDDKTTVTALSQAREDRVRWTLVSDHGDNVSYGFLGDANGDGAAEMVEIRSVATRESGDSFEEDVEYTVLDGRDLEPLWTIEATFRVLWQTGSDTGPGLGGDHSITELDMPLLLTGLAGAGSQVLTYHVRDRYDSSGVASLEWYEAEHSLGSTIEHFDAAGVSQWSAGGVEMLLRGAGTDADGDGVGDLLFATQRVSHQGGGLELPLLGDPLMEEREPPRLEVQAHSGADGRVLWHHEEATETQMVLVSWFPGVLGTGPLALINKLHVEVEESLMTTQVRLSSSIHLLEGEDGSSGLEVGQDDAWQLAQPLGDLDEDGRPEFLIHTIDLGQASTRAVDGDLETRWSDTTMRSAVGDLNGDGVADLLSMDTASAEARDGRDNSPMWELKDVAPSGLLHDLDHDGGLDLYTLHQDEDGVAHAELYNGAQGTLIWSKPILDPADYAGGLEELELSLDAHYVGDIERDGALDLVLRLSGAPPPPQCDGDACHAQGGNDHRRVAVEALVSGIDGQGILRFDDMRLRDGVASIADSQARLGPAGVTMQSRLDQDASAVGSVFSGLALLGLVAVLRRR